MNQVLLKEMIDRALAGTITFPEVLAALGREGVEAYHVDFLRNEWRYYAAGGDSFATPVPFLHGGVAATFSAEALHAINQRVQAGAARFADFVREGTAAGCAYYIVYLNGKKVRYFGRDGGEHVQHFPGSN
jgi:uncharacterized protein YbcV (DUF1398 family)